MARDHHSTKRGKPHVHMKLVMHTSLILHDHGGDRIALVCARCRCVTPQTVFLSFEALNESESYILQSN